MDLVKITVDALRGSFGLAAAAYALSAIGLNLQFGYTGLVNLGHIASMLVGAYGTAIVVDAGGSLLLGGPGTIWGPVVGSILFWLLFEWFDGFIVAAIGEGWFGNLLTDIDAGPLRTVLLGAGLILLVVFRPQGLLGNREEVLLDDG